MTDAIRSQDSQEPRAFELRFGALADPLMTQLRAQGLRPRPDAKKDLHHLQKDADALVRLCVRGYINDSLKFALQRRIMREVRSLLRQETRTNQETP